MNKDKTKIPTRPVVSPHARVSETKRSAVQLTSRVEKKSGPAAPSAPGAPPVYRPQPTPRVLQKKAITTSTSPDARKPAQQGRYNPQPVPKVLQRKDVRKLAPNTVSTTPVGSRPNVALKQPTGIVRRGPANVRSAAIQRAAAHPGGPPPPGPPPPASSAAASAAAVTCPLHQETYLDECGDCWKCQSQAGKVQQKPDKVKKKVEVTVNMEEWSRENREVARNLLADLSGNQITHRGSKAPQDERRPNADDLVNHESSGAPVWFTVGGSATGADIEKYPYHHVLTLNRPVNIILGENLGQVLNHSEGSSGESTWSGYMMKTNEPGCFAVSRDKLHEFYRQFVSRHELKSKPKSGRK